MLCKLVLIDSDSHSMFACSSGRYVMLKLLRSENEADNIDLQYVGLMGYFGARSFAIGSLC